MSYLNLPDAVQKTIRESLQSMGQNENDQKVDSYALLLEQAQPGAESCDNFLNAEGLRNFDEAELCKKFGIEPEKLQKEFSYLFSNILHVFNFLKTGNVEASYQDSEKMSPAEILEDTSLDKSRDTTETLDIATILKMLVIIHEKF